MKQVVLDASAATRLVLAHPETPSHWLTTLEEADSVRVPNLYFSEVANALWKYVRSDLLDETTALERLGEARRLATTTIPDEDLMEEALSTAVRFEHPVYDALYAVLARRHGCPILTADERLKKLLTALRVGWV